MQSSDQKTGFIDKIQNFLGSYTGKIWLNYAYSWGAAVVILGTLFKLTHIKGADIMLFVGMGCEVFVFFISAFDRPSKSYKWEAVFPALKQAYAAENALEQPTTQETMQRATAHSTEAISPNTTSNHGTNPILGVAGSATSGSTPQTGVYLGSPILNEAVAKDSPEVIDATQLYLEQLKEMTETLSRFSSSTNSLSTISDTLLASFQSISDNSGNITLHAQGYAGQLESLNRNLNGLNTIYEIQLKGISSQLDTIDKVNVGLNQIKAMYTESIPDSEKFQKETEKMALQITELNAVYARMLQAMTVNMSKETAN